MSFIKFSGEYVADCFIGRKFGENNQLEVIETSGRNKSGALLYKVLCKTCVKDVELFGDGIFIVAKADLIRGMLPCGCSSKHHYTETQYKILINRECKQRGYEFLGHVGNWTGHSTKLTLKCGIDGNIWSTTTLSSFMNSGSGCPMCIPRIISSSTRKSDDDIVNGFLDTGRFPVGAKFSRNEELTRKYKRVFWNMYCPLCSNDKYVKAGVCSGVFVSPYTSLYRGNVPCRCSTARRWSREEREFQIKENLEDDGSIYTFVGWESDYNGTSSKLRLLCRLHGEWTPSLVSFMNGSRCPSCASYGYNKHKDGNVYVLKVSGSEGGFTGYGVTNDIATRMKSHKRNLRNNGFSIKDVVVFPSFGENAIDLEAMIKKKFPIKSQDVKGFITEATDIELYDEVVKFIRTVISDRISYVLIGAKVENNA